MKLEAKKLLLDVITACRDVEQFTAGRTFDDYLGNEMLRAAVERKFEVIGEALVRLRAKGPDRFCESVPVTRRSRSEIALSRATMQSTIGLSGKLSRTICKTLKAEAEQFLGDER